jgi:hypothetical protein
MAGNWHILTIFSVLPQKRLFLACFPSAKMILAHAFFVFPHPKSVPAHALLLLAYAKSRPAHAFFI